MTNTKDFLNVINQKIDYKNFSEEVTIVSESKTGSNYSLYTITNKNGTTFQKVPGLGDITDKGFMGYINGDHGRPAIIGGLAKTTNSLSSASDPGWPVVDVLATFTWDVQLVATSAYGSDTETKTVYVLTL